MGKIISYIAISLNGKIAKANGDVSWLDKIPNPDLLDYGYYNFYDSIDTTIMGNKTYELLMSWDIDFPYPEKKNYVLSRNTALKNNEHVEFITTDHINFLKNLKADNKKNIWLIGGGEVNTMILNAGLLDTMIIHVMPIILNGGIELFAELPQETLLELVSSKSYPTGVLETIYRIK